MVHGLEIDYELIEKVVYCGLRKLLDGCWNCDSLVRCLSSYLADMQKGFFPRCVSNLRNNLWL